MLVLTSRSSTPFVHLPVHPHCQLLSVHYSTHPSPCPPTLLTPVYYSTHPCSNESLCTFPTFVKMAKSNKARNTYIHATTLLRLHSVCCVFSYLIVLWVQCPLLHCGLELRLLVLVRLEVPATRASQSVLGLAPCQQGSDRHCTTG